MFRELRRPRGDPKVLASQSREQYFKVINCGVWDSYFIFPVLVFLPSLASKIKEFSRFLLNCFSVKKEVANPHTGPRWCWFSLSLCFLFP